MNILYKVTFFIVMLISTRCQPENAFVKVQKSEINKVELEFAIDLADKILSKQKWGVYYGLNPEEATTEMIDGLNEEIQKQSYQKIKSMFGDYKSLKFESLYIGTDENNYKIYRLKGIFESNSNVEVRVVINQDRKLAGFFVRSWRREL